MNKYILLVVSIFLIGCEYRDRVTCPNFKAEYVQAIAHDAGISIWYPDGRQISVKGDCIIEHRVLPVRAEK